MPKVRTVRILPGKCVAYSTHTFHDTVKSSQVWPVRPWKASQQKRSMNFAAMEISTSMMQNDSHLDGRLMVLFFLSSFIFSHAERHGSAAAAYRPVLLLSMASSGCSRWLGKFPILVNIRPVVLLLFGRVCSPSLEVVVLCHGFEVALSFTFPDLQRLPLQHCSCLVASRTSKTEGKSPLAFIGPQFMNQFHFVFAQLLRLCLAATVH